MGERDGSGYWATWIGSIVGFFAGGAIGAWIGAATVPPDAGLEGILNLVLGMAIGAWVGSVAGLWCALKFAGRRVAGTTATWFFLLSPIVVGAFIVLGGAVSTELGDGVAFVLIGMGVVLNGYLARRLALRSDGADIYGSPPEAKV